MVGETARTETPCVSSNFPEALSKLEFFEKMADAARFGHRMGQTTCRSRRRLQPRRSVRGLGACRRPARRWRQGPCVVANREQDTRAGARTYQKKRRWSSEPEGQQRSPDSTGMASDADPEAYWHRRFGQQATPLLEDRLGFLPGRKRLNYQGPDCPDSGTRRHARRKS